MKKRILALALVLVMVCGLFAGCSQEGTSALQGDAKAISDAVSNTVALDDISLDMKMNMSMSAAGMTVAMPVNMKVKTLDGSSSNPTVWTEFSISILGQKLEGLLYQEDGWSYVVQGETKFKSQNENRVGEYNYSSEIMQQLPDSILETAEIVKNDDGSITATVSIPSEEFSEIYGDLVDKLNTESGTDVDIQISDAVVTITAKGEYLSEYGITFSMDVTTSGVTTTMDIDTAVTFDNPGQPVKITPPEGYQDFEDLTNPA